MFPVMEAFYTIQGEGFHSGRAAYFIRLAGCDVGCVWCDVKESWDAGAHSLQSAEEIVKLATESQSRFAVITGGEPAMYDLTPLSRLLHEAGFEIAIETSGAYPLKGDIDWICLSPKKFKAPLPDMLNRADEFKVVINHSSDFSWAEGLRTHLQDDCRCYLQPEHSRFDEHIGPIIDYVKRYPGWKISLQIHKIIHVP
jgi:organic radical activating enzyme